MSSLVWSLEIAKTTFVDLFNFFRASLDGLESIRVAAMESSCAEGSSAGLWSDSDGY